MGPIRTIALTVLVISLIVFIALFGRLPVFRKTPIGLCHRIIWIYIPRGFFSVDTRLTGGRVFGCLRRTENYLMNEKHPLVLIFFILMMSVGQSLFVPAAWSHLSSINHVFVPMIITLTYTLLYLGVTTSSSITHMNHQSAIRHYPYDHTLYHPGIWCQTCQFPKPARSKHCSICKTCMSKMDHHCIWLNNCVGRNNYIWFLTLLLSVSIMLMYCVILGHGILDADLQLHFPGPPSSSGTPLHWTRTSPPMTWSLYFNMWAICLSSNLRIGSVTLLCLMCFPLSTGLLAYHIYLIWAGMTTNETVKWADWRDDVNWGIVWRARRVDLLEDYPLSDERLEPREGDIDERWHGDRSGIRDTRVGEGENRGWWVIRVRNRKEIVRRWRPKVTIEGESNGGNGQQQQTEMEPGEPDERWQRVNGLEEMVNIYDLGFWENLMDVIWNRGD